MKGRLLSLKNPRDSVYSGGVLDGSPADRPKSRRCRRRIVVAILVACVLVVGAALAVDYWTNGGRIYPGVEVAGANLGGETPEEARAILDERTGGLEEIELTGSERVTLSSDELGVDFDAWASADQAYAVGRRGNILERARERIEATWGTVPLPLAVNYERERLQDGLASVIAGLTVEPVEAGFEVDGSEVSVTESRTGRSVDEEELLDAVEAGLPEGRRGYELSVVSEEPELTTEEAMELRPTTLLGKYRTDYRETSDKSPGNRSTSGGRI